VGLATLGRLVGSSFEELLALQGMNRIRHAYLEMVPELDPYVSASRYDDLGSILSIYGATPATPGALNGIAHGLTTMPGLIGVLDAAIAGALAGAVVAAVGGDMRASLLAGIAAAIVAGVAMVALSVRVFGGRAAQLVTRFPAPDVPALQPPGRRNT
jgi:hypothetical protein